MKQSARRSSLAGEGTGLRALGGAVDLGFQLYARLRARELADADPVATQERTLRSLVSKARATRFGRDHHFEAIGSVAEFQQSVRLRTYEALWDEYLRACYPVLDNVTWPGRIRFFALTSGTTEGATKYIPVSAEMMASNSKAARTMLAAFVSSRPDSKLFRGRLFFLGGSTALVEPAPGVLAGDLSGIAAVDLAPLWRAFTFPPLELALDTDWDRKLSRLAESCCGEPITLISGVPSWLLLLFQRVLAATGKAAIADVWPGLELVVHGGVKFDPYRESFRSILGSPRIQLQETYPCSEGFIAFGDSHSGLLRLLFDHGLFYEFVPVEEIDAPRPTRHWLATAELGVNYAIVVSTCAGMWAHQIGDTVRFESLDPPVITFTGRTRYTLSAFGEHLISEEVEAAIAAASSTSSAPVRDWHLGPVFCGSGGLGHHQFVVEFLREPTDLERFRDALDADLSRRNDDYLAHRLNNAALPAPALVVAAPGSFDAWMRRRGKLGGQNKVPRMDNSGKLTRDLVEFLRSTDRVALELGSTMESLDEPAGTASRRART
jgi:GH3 auxin-responsive promoter